MFGSGKDDRGFGNRSVLRSELLALALCANAQSTFLLARLRRIGLSSGHLDDLLQ